MTTSSPCASCGRPVAPDASACPACGAARVLPERTATYQTPGTAAPVALGAPAGPTAPPRIAGYVIERPLGEGGMGAVFLAHDETLGRSVAIKVISGGADATAEARFLREARAMASAVHPNIVRVLSFGTAEGRPYLVMELVDGESLADRLKRVRRFELDEALSLLRPVVEALAAAWRKGIVHRDVKPANILLDRGGGVRVADFGLAKGGAVSAGGDLTQEGLVLGTPYYLAPEQASGLPTDFRTDIYALGIVLWEMLTGERPFNGPSPLAIAAKHLHQPLPSLAALRPDVPREAQALLAKMTAKDPQQRHASYALLLRDFDRILGGVIDAEIVPADTGSGRRLVVALVLILAALALLVFLAQQPRPSPAPPVAATPVPQATPLPAATPAPTPEPSPTPWPTMTPVPTATPYPVYAPPPDDERRQRDERRPRDDRRPPLGPDGRPLPPPPGWPPPPPPPGSAGAPPR